MDDQDVDRAGAVVGFFDDETGLDDFFTPAPRASVGRTEGKQIAQHKEKPTHYKVVSVSLYLDDIERLNTLVEAMKARGFTRMNRSLMIREALRQIDLDQIPPQR